MPEINTLILFTLASLALIVVPGPAVLYIIARSLEQGRLAGLASVLGVGAGALVHFIAAALGLSALLASSALAFSIIKYAGAAYLIYLGFYTLFSKRKVKTAEVKPHPLGSVFIQGIVVNLLSPKMALFALAFLPQFLDPTRGSLAVQALVLGSVFVTIAFLSDGLYALLAGGLGSWLRQHVGFLRAQRYVSGGVYLALGVATAFTGSSKK